MTVTGCPSCALCAAYSHVPNAESPAVVQQMLLLHSISVMQLNSANQA